MELKAILHYNSPAFCLTPGETTVGKDISEAEKVSLYEALTEYFEIIASEDLKIETPEDSLNIETPEDKLPKTRKK